MTLRITSTDSLKPLSVLRDVTAHEFLLPSDLREFQVELAGRLVMHDEPGLEVKALREKYGFTQEFLATLCDLRRESLSRIESGAVGLSLPFVQRFVRVMTLARGVREHLAYAESRGNAPDERQVDMLAMTLRVEPEAREEIVLASMVSYERKRREALRALPSAGRLVPRTTIGERAAPTSGRIGVRKSI